MSVRMSSFLDCLKSKKFLILLAVGVTAFWLSSPVFGYQKAGENRAKNSVRAQLTPVNFTTLSTELAGRISTISVRDGDYFTQNSVLVGLDCSIYQMEMRKALADLQVATANLVAIERLKELNSASELEMGKAIAELARAEAQADVMTATIERCEIHAPFQGRVMDVFVREHQYVAAGDPLIRVLDDRELEVDMLVPSVWLTWIEEGSSFEFNVDELETPYTAVVISIGAYIDPVSQSIRVRGTIQGDFPELMAGMSGTAEFLIPVVDQP